MNSVNYLVISPLSLRCHSVIYSVICSFGHSVSRSFIH